MPDKSLNELLLGGEMKRKEKLSARYGDIQALVDGLRNQDGCHVVVALSHCGTDATGTAGEDVELARRVHLSPPATHARVKRLEKAGAFVERVVPALWPGDAPIGHFFTASEGADGSSARTTCRFNNCFKDGWETAMPGGSVTCTCRFSDCLKDGSTCNG